MRRLALVLLGACLFAGNARADDLGGPLQMLDTATLRDDAAPRALRLPFNADLVDPGGAGPVQLDVHWQQPEDNPGPVSIYVPSIGNRYALRLNGMLVSQQGRLAADDPADFAKLPQLVTVPAQLLRSDNTLQVNLYVDPLRRAGLSEIYLGPPATVWPLYRRHYLLRAAGSLAVTVFSAILAMLALALWWTQPRMAQTGSAPRQRDNLYLFAGCAELFWVLAVGDALIEHPPLPWTWWSSVPLGAAGAWACCVILFASEVAGWSARPGMRHLRRWLATLAVLSFIAPGLASVLHLPPLLTLWHLTLALTCIPFGTVFLLRTGWRSSGAQKLVALALVVNIATGAYDLFTFRIHPSFPDNSLVRFSSLLFGLTLAHVVIERFRHASEQAALLTESLAARLQAREAELADRYRTSVALVRAQERAEERARILRDMHDGVGSHLSSAIHQLRSGRSSTDTVLATLQDSLDQLKLTVDSIELAPGDVNGLLANLRNRLEPRFDSINLALVWHVEELPLIAALDADAMLELRFMLFEMLSNALQHAAASELHVQATSAGGRICLRVIDNGCGFDPLQAGRRGLRTLQERARRINSALTLESRPGRTMVQLQLG